jgi:chromosome segregation ATPase
LEGLRTKLAGERAAIQSAQEESEAAQAEFARARERLETERQQLAAGRDRLAALETETKSQRRRIAREFQVQRATHLAELERRRTELQSLSESTHSELTERSATAQQEAQELRQQLAQLRKLLNARADELNELRAEAARRSSEIDGLRSELGNLRSEHDRLTEELADRDSAAGTDDEQLARLCAQRDELARKLSEAQQTPASAGLDEEQQEKLDEMQRRFELAVEDVRDLKRRNADLETRLAKAQTAAPAAAAAAISGGLDWEAQKRRMLAALEADEANEADEDDGQREERLSIESTINITDQVLAEKDREIADLKQLLGQQSSNLGSMAVGAQAVAAIFDQDELIRQERERLAHLQDECKETLRQAEIDISLERAKITRDRAEIDEKLAGLQADVADRKAASDAATDTCKQGKPVRGRWLARLGLKELEE